jgi:flagellar protein FliS
MSYASQTSSYREMEIHAASPERLLVIVFEQLVVNLERARIAMERNDVELRVASLRRARGLVAELLSTLDFENGGEIALNLQQLYEWLRSVLVKSIRAVDPDAMQQARNVVGNLTEAWQQIGK